MQYIHPPHSAHSDITELLSECSVVEKAICGEAVPCQDGSFSDVFFSGHVVVNAPQSCTCQIFYALCFGRHAVVSDAPIIPKRPKYIYINDINAHYSKGLLFLKYTLRFHQLTYAAWLEVVLMPKPNCDHFTTLSTCLFWSPWNQRTPDFILACTSRNTKGKKNSTERVCFWNHRPKEQWAFVFRQMDFWANGIFFGLLGVGNKGQWPYFNNLKLAGLKVSSNHI